MGGVGCGVGAQCGSRRNGRVCGVLAVCRRRIGGVFGGFSGYGGAVCVPVWGFWVGCGVFSECFRGFFGVFRGVSREVLGFSGDFVGLAHHFVPVLWRVGVGYRKLVFGWSVFGEGVCIGVSGPGSGC